MSSDMRPQRKYPRVPKCFTLWQKSMCMRSKAWLAESVWLRLARLPPPASRMRRSRRLRDTLAAAPGLLAHASVTQAVKFCRMGPKLRHPAQVSNRLSIVFFSQKTMRLPVRALALRNKTHESSAAATAACLTRIRCFLDPHKLLRARAVGGPPL